MFIKINKTYKHIIRGFDNMNYNFLIIGGDKRISYLANKLLKDENSVYTFANKVEGVTEINEKEEIKKYNYDIVISSMPLSVDNENVYTPLSNKKMSLKELKEISKGKIIIAGKIPNLFTKKCKDDDTNEKIECYDILQDEVTTILNTIPTAEGAIQVAMQETNYTLNGKRALVIGFGRVGKTLANMLGKLGLQVYCEARKDTDLAWIKAYGYKEVHLDKMNNILCKMDIVFNTVPTIILDKSRLLLINKKTLIIDLASAPGGVDYITAEKLGIKAILASALPGKVAPFTCAEYLQEFVYKVCKLSRFYLMHLIELLHTKLQYMFWSF